MYVSPRVWHVFHEPLWRQRRAVEQAGRASCVTSSLQPCLVDILRRVPSAGGRSGNGEWIATRRCWDDRSPARKVFVSGRCRAKERGISPSPVDVLVPTDTERDRTDLLTHDAYADNLAAVPP